MTILLGDGTGGFTQATGSPVGVGAWPRSAAVGDFDLDGAPDLVTANYGDGTVTILLGDGMGGFTGDFNSSKATPILFSVAGNPYSVAVGDFNRDGAPDLVTANSSNTVTILLGNGTGAFTEATDSPVGVGYYPVSVAVGDFNRDGTPDLVTANYPSSTVTILLGDGTGGFTQATGSPVGVGAQPHSVAVSDFNRDGAPDLTTANYGGGTVTILLGDGTGGFTQATGSPIGVGVLPRPVAVGDFDLDGKPDLAVADSFRNHVTILLNTCTSPQYSFAGFFPPVDNLPVLNQLKAGQGIPVRFSLGGDYGLDILATGYPVSQPIACESGAPVDTIEQALTISSSRLTYDATTDTYTYVWKTDKGWTGQCRELILRLTDGTEHLAHF